MTSLRKVRSRSTFREGRCVCPVAAPTGLGISDLLNLVASVRSQDGDVDVRGNDFSTDEVWTGGGDHLSGPCGGRCGSCPASVGPPVPPEPRRDQADRTVNRVITPGRTSRNPPVPCRVFVVTGFVPPAEVCSERMRSEMGSDSTLYLEFYLSFAACLCRTHKVPTHPCWSVRRSSESCRTTSGDGGDSCRARTVVDTRARRVLPLFTESTRSTTLRSPKIREPPQKKDRLRKKVSLGPTFGGLKTFLLSIPVRPTVSRPPGSFGGRQSGAAP